VRACGRPDEADRAFQKAFELYARKGDVVSAERARAVVDTVPAWRAGRA
jgi:hypothetical protein